MKINNVNGVSFKNNNRILFEGRKDKGKNYLSNPVSHKLAIPAAALILSMYPSNPITAQDKFGPDKVTELYKKSDKFEILHTRVLENWGRYAEDEDIVPKLTAHFISNDGNQDNIESVIIEFNSSKRNPQAARVFLNLKYLKRVEKKVKAVDINDIKYVGYGDAIICNHTGMRHASGFGVDLNKDTFDYLSQLIDSEMNNNAIFKGIIVEEK